MSRLLDKVAVVTGAGNGIGQAIALRLGEEGAKLVLGDIDAVALERTAETIRAGGGTAIAIVGDVTTVAGAQGLADAALTELGGIDILVNNVGGGGQGKLLEIAPEDFEKALTLNLVSTFLCTRAVISDMIKRGSGSIVCISSGAKDGVQWLSNLHGATGYAAAKAGVIGFMREAALQLGEHGVRINALAVGAVDTERAKPFFDHLNESYPLSPKVLVPLHRAGKPQEIANAVLFLASDEASYITGATLNVNGGRT
jgi:NAD(P)-dependent dehydrogenase (short-subunit alcohol dehydrogenase family)